MKNCRPRFRGSRNACGYYSKGREDEKVEIDYLQKNVKKPNGAALIVVYYTNYSLTIHPDILGLTLSLIKNRRVQPSRFFYFQNTFSRNLSAILIHPL